MKSKKLITIVFVLMFFLNFSNAFGAKNDKYQGAFLEVPQRLGQSIGYIASMPVGIPLGLSFSLVGPKEFGYLVGGMVMAASSEAMGHVVKAPFSLMKKVFYDFPKRKYRENKYYKY